MFDAACVPANVEIEPTPFILNKKLRNGVSFEMSVHVPGSIHTIFCDLISYLTHFATFNLFILILIANTGYVTFY